MAAEIEFPVVFADFREHLLQQRGAFFLFGGAAGVVIGQQLEGAGLFGGELLVGAVVQLAAPHFFVYVHDGFLSEWMKVFLRSGLTKRRAYAIMMQNA